MADTGHSVEEEEVVEESEGEKEEQQDFVDEIEREELEKKAAVGEGEKEAAAAVSLPLPGDEIDRDKALTREQLQEGGEESEEEEYEGVPPSPGGGGEPPPAVPGDEIDVPLDVPLDLPQQQLDFNQLNNALQHVQGHMDSMMHNLGGLHSSVKSLKRSSEQAQPRDIFCETRRKEMTTGLHTNILQFWREGTFSDLTLVDDAGLKHKVHRMVLASRSDYWRAQLTNWNKEDKVIQVSIVTSHILKIVLEFIYSLDVKRLIENSNVVEVLQAANIYHLQLLSEECVQFLRQRISLGNILEVLSFSHVDGGLETHATDFLARNFTKFLHPMSRRQELLDLSVYNITLILRSKQLILRDSHALPVRAVARETAILLFLLEYIEHRPAARIKQLAGLLGGLRMHLLPLDKDRLEYSEGRWLPKLLLDLVNRHSVPSSLLSYLEQLEKDVKQLHTSSLTNSLYWDTAAQQGINRGKHTPHSISLGERNSCWAAQFVREASVAHEWWTAHDHDSRFVSSFNSSNIVAVSGSASGEKYIRKLTFCLGEVHENSDLLPSWFHYSAHYNNLQSMHNELGEYIGAIQVVWSTGKENWLGRPQGLTSGRAVVCLEEEEHIVEVFQIFWGPRQVFVPLEVVDLVLVTNKGRKFGPFTKQVKKYYEEMASSKEWCFTDIVRSKLSCKRICRRVDSPYRPLSRPDSLAGIKAIQDNLEGDSCWSCWLDGFLCVIKNDKITRITLKFAVYLDCFYQEKKKAQRLLTKPGKSEDSAPAPVLLSFSLEDLQENMTAAPVRIMDSQHLHDHTLSPFAENQDDTKSKKLRRAVSRDRRRGTEDESPEHEQDVNPMAEAQQVALADQEAGDDVINEPEEVPPGEVVGNNNEGVFLEEEWLAPNEDEGAEQNEEDGEEGDHLHGDLWDALVDDDLGPMGGWTLKIEQYLE